MRHGPGQLLHQAGAVDHQPDRTRCRFGLNMLGLGLRLGELKPEEAIEGQ
jgi:hypothetical protein